MSSVLILNGPNLNLLGTRQPDVYGATTLEDIENLCREAADRLGMSISFEQTNHEGTLIDQIHAAKTSHIAIILNAGAFTHTSIAIMDAIGAAERAEAHNSRSPEHYFQDQYKKSLRAYTMDYLKEEVFDEGLTRNIPVFSRFFDARTFIESDSRPTLKKGKDPNTSSFSSFNNGLSDLEILSNR